MSAHPQPDAIDFGAAVGPASFDEIVPVVHATLRRLEGCGLGGLTRAELRRAERLWMAIAAQEGQPLAQVRVERRRQHARQLAVWFDGLLSHEVRADGATSAQLLARVRAVPVAGERDDSQPVRRRVLRPARSVARRSVTKR